MNTFSPKIMRNTKKSHQEHVLFYMHSFFLGGEQIVILCLSDFL